MTCHRIIFVKFFEIATMTTLNCSLASFIANIFRISKITCSDHCYCLGKLENQRMEELERQRKQDNTGNYY